MKKYIKNLLRESLLIESIKKQYNAWVMPSDKMLEQEYTVEHEFKGKKIWESLKDFIGAVKNAPIVEVDEAMDNKIYNRSRTKTFDSLHNLIKSYRSYPKFRNEDTLKNLYTRIKNNEPLDYPIVLKYKDGYMIIFSGNTRMDVAFQMGVNPKVLMVELS